MWFAASIFVFSLAGVVGLLALKDWENKRGRVLLPASREAADRWALHLAELFAALRSDLEKLPPEIVHISRIIIHEMALAVAASLRFLEKRAHQLADLVSHKHRFERRAPRSEFLKKVSEGKRAGMEQREERAALEESD